MLASASQVRRRLLENAAVKFRVIPSEVAEAPLKEIAFREGRSPEELALILAEAKARAVSSRESNTLVVGADQVLECDGRTFDKPATIEEARQNLQIFRAKTHRLWSAVSVVRGEDILWQVTAVAELTMHNFDDDELDCYLALAGDDVMDSVGVYRLEGLGARLFEKIDGDYFTILGLPLLPLLAFLRGQGLTLE